MLSFLAACGSSEERYQRQLTASHEKASRSLSVLSERIDSGLIRNAKYIDAYADVVKRQKPELTEIVELVQVDATLRSPVFEGLQTRLDDSARQIDAAAQAGGDTANQLLTELSNLNNAASSEVYDAMLADSVNVLADMSDGSLSRVSSLSKRDSLSANGAADMGEGSQYVGNPNYGSWQTGNNGSSFWSWYGKYALFSSLFNRGPIGYGYWSSNRDYSYYHDNGRSSFSSPAQKSRAVQTETRARNTFASQGRSFNSPYARAKSSGTRPRTPSYNTRTSSSTSSRSVSRGGK
ncbi:MAG: hypothetical protein COC19_03970 [SAR86 cluster bacterium]|uniref:Uncharacterized protein n=1 Tax=SAR86 cluster bacterium TaxID=2030880 RepID=A0A2A4MPS2_9GAMM|nr:MAG: hypothetical protein COC19_03970 [SAR86 cluster bacterium]